MGVSDESVRVSEERLTVLEVFIRNQCALTDKHPHTAGPGSVTLNNEEALLCAEALERVANADASRAQSERDAVDARRYRWLRKGEPQQIFGDTASQCSGLGPHVVMELPGVSPRRLSIFGTTLDVQIDSALAALSSTPPTEEGER